MRTKRPTNEKTALRAFEERKTNVAKLLKRIAAEVETFDKAGSSKPGGHDWAYAGTMAHVEEQLVNVLRSLGGK